MNPKSTNPFLFLTFHWTARVVLFLTAVYCKPTFTGLLTPLDSLIFSLLNRCFNICSTYAIFNTELEKLKSILIQNAYLENLVNQCITSFLNKAFSCSTKAISVPKLILYFPLPFTGQHFLKIKTQINIQFAA